MKLLQTLAAMPAAIYYASSVIAEDVKSPEWLVVHTAPTAEMTPDTALGMPVIRKIFAFTDIPNRIYGYINAYEFVCL